MIGPLILIFVVLAVFGVPIAVGMGVAVLLTMAVLTPFPVLGMVQRMVTGIDSFVLISIPFFMLTGRLMNAGGITNDLFRFARSLVGPIRGGLAHANVIANMILHHQDQDEAEDHPLVLGRLELGGQVGEVVAEDLSGAPRAKHLSR